MCSRLFYDLDNMKQIILHVFTFILRLRPYETENALCFHDILSNFIFLLQ
jgi:hypothetical protein